MKVITKKKIQQLQIEQGRNIAAILEMPGWKVIENIILLTKSNAEADRRSKLATDPNGSKALYFSGKVDGAEEARANVLDAVEQAKNLIAQAESEDDQGEQE